MRLSHKPVSALARAREGQMAVVLLSGGLDSTTLLALARRQGFRCHCLTFAYGQRHAVELRAARKVAKALAAEQHLVIALDTKCFRGSALTDRSLPVPKARPRRAAQRDAIPNTYVPARNTIFLAYALAYAETVGSRDIFIGVNAVDFSGYPDCRPDYIQAFQRLARLATRTGVSGSPARIHAPLLRLSKAQIIRLGARLGVDYGLSHSCYDPDRQGRACGLCDSCRLRRQGFVAAGVADPTVYAPAYMSRRKKDVCRER